MRKRINEVQRIERKKKKIRKSKCDQDEVR